MLLRRTMTKTEISLHPIEQKKMSEMIFCNNMRRPIDRNASIITIRRRKLFSFERTPSNSPIAKEVLGSLLNDIILEMVIYMLCRH